MKRIAITGSNKSDRTLLANALSYMTGLNIILIPSYTSIASKYKLCPDIFECQWPDSYVYCLGAYTQRIITEQNYEGKFISDGGVFHELCWIKARYPNTELIYERSMIQSLENVVVEYASKEYDFIFHIETNSSQDVTDQCLKQLFLQRNISYQLIDATDKEKSLNQLLSDLDMKPLLSSEHSFLKAKDKTYQTVG